MAKAKTVLAGKVQALELVVTAAVAAMQVAVVGAAAAVVAMVVATVAGMAAAIAPAAPPCMLLAKPAPIGTIKAKSAIRPIFVSLVE